jgi:hypothetical protein
LCIDFYMIKLNWLLFLTFPFLSISQENISFSDSSYIKSMRSKLNLRLGLDNDIESFEFEDGINRYSVQPNTDLRMTIGINHKFLNLKIGFSPKFLANADSSEKGSTKMFRFASTIFIKNWAQYLEFSNITGYYIEDISDNNFSLLENGEYILLPDMKTRTFRGITSYKFNDNF